MSPDLPATLPPSAVEAAAEALADTVATAGWIFRGRYPQYEESRERWRDRVRVVLAAALAECEVHEYVGVLWPNGGFVRHPVGGAEYVASLYQGAVTARQLTITTKPEPVASPVDTPREETK